MDENISSLPIVDKLSIEMNLNQKIPLEIVFTNQLWTKMENWM